MFVSGVRQAGLPPGRASPRRPFADLSVRHLLRRRDRPVRTCRAGSRLAVSAWALLGLVSIASAVVGAEAHTTPAVRVGRGPSAASGAPAPGGDARPSVGPAVLDGVDSGRSTFIIRIDPPASSGEEAGRVDGGADGEDVAGTAGLQPSGIEMQGTVRRVARADRIRALRVAGQSRLARIMPALDALAAEGHVATVEAFPLLGMVAVTGDATALRALTRLPEVRGVDQNRVHDADLPPAVQGAARATEWNIASVGAPMAWRDFAATGEGVVVATIDTGADWLHPLIRAAYRGRDGRHDFAWADVVEPSAARPAPADDHGHGTLVLGLIVGRDARATYGVAPGAQWIAVRAFDARGRTTDVRLLRAASWILAPTDVAGGRPRPDLAPDVVNCSWVLDNGADPLLAAIVDAWRAAGILPVFAAGNDDDGTGTFAGVLAPASDPDVIAVGAMTRAGAMWALSKGGPSFDGAIKPDLVAPGVDVLSAGSGGGLATGEGTSMAAPHVSGAAALVLGVDPALGVDAVADLLRVTATDGGATGPDNEWGWGALDAGAAVARAVVSGRVGGQVTDEGGAMLAVATVSAYSPRRVAPTVRPVSTGADGRWELVVPAGEWSVTAGAPGYLTVTRGVSVDPQVTTRLDVRLAASGRATVRGRVVGTDGSGIAGVRVRVDGAGLESATAAQGEYALPCPEGRWTLRFDAGGKRAVTTTVTAGAGSEITRHVVLEDAPRVLLVDADAYTGQRIHRYLDRAIGDAGYASDVWTVDAPDDVPGLTDLASYDVVVWAHLYGSPGTLDARLGDHRVTDVLTRYVAQGGRLVVTGQDVASRDAPATQGGGGAAPEFAARVLGVRLVAGQVDATRAWGSGPWAGLALNLRSSLGHLKGGRFAPDAIAPADAPGATAVPGLTYPDGRAAAIAASDAAGRRAFLAFGPESAGDRAALAVLFDRLFAWMSAPSVAFEDAQGVLAPRTTGRFALVLRGARAAVPVSITVTLPAELLAEPGVGALDLDGPHRLRWDGHLASGASRTLDFAARLAAATPGRHTLRVVAEASVARRVMTTTAMLHPLAPDLGASTVVVPGRLARGGEVGTVLRIANTGLAHATHVTAMLRLPAGLVVDGASPGASQGETHLDAGAGILAWRGAVAADGIVTVTLGGRLPDGVGETHHWRVVLDEVDSGVVTRTASVLVGGPDLSGAEVITRPTFLNAGDAMSLTLRLPNRGRAPADAAVTMVLPPGIDPAWTGGGLAWDVGTRTLVSRATILPGQDAVVSLPLRARSDVAPGDRNVRVTVDDGAVPAAAVGFDVPVKLRRPALDASTTVILPAEARSGDTVTATVLVSNAGNVPARVEVVDSLPPLFTLDVASVDARSGQVRVEPATIRWTADVAPAADDYAWSPMTGRVTVAGQPLDPPRDDVSGAYGPIALSFAFPFYTAVYTRVWVTGDGLLAFAPPAGRPGGDAPGVPDIPSAAALWRADRGGAHRPLIRSRPDALTVVWTAGRPGAAVAVDLDRTGALRFVYGSGVDPTGAWIGLRGPDGRGVDVPPRDVPPGWALEFDPPGGWTWLSFRARLGVSLAPNSRVAHTVHLVTPGFDRVLTGTVAANRLNLGTSTLEVEPQTPAAGGVLRYRAVIAATGAIDARDVEVRIASPDWGETFPETLTGGLVSDASGDLVWRGRVARGAPGQVTWSVRVPEHVAPGARLVARAVVSCADVPTVVLTRAVRLRATDLSGSGKWVDRPVAWPGDRVTFRLRAANAGPHAAFVRLTDALPSALAFVPGSAWSSAGDTPRWQGDARAVTWSGELPAASAVEIRLAATFLGPGEATNAMWLDDDRGTRYAAWAQVTPARVAAYLPAVLGASP
jgi:uncharacterized repeat protein (TIGR01451 family)